MAKVEKSKENLKKCSCMKCPSYTFMCKMKNMPGNMMSMMKGDLSKVAHMEGMFCAFGKSKCINIGKGCICATCDVYKENSLNKLYYCLAEGER
ncbi:DUF2769 domain-containing protein [Candidatus Woesearchaeota archaeon]|nr:DUF2769 domain-containing protein [Candidatus Woesearchaeota archaeon]